MEDRSLATDVVMHEFQEAGLVRLEYSPSTLAHSGSLHFDFRDRGKGGAASLSRHAMNLEEMMASSHDILAELNQDRDLRDRLNAALPLMLRVIHTDTVAVFVVRDERSAELIAAYGPTRRRGYPYADLDLMDGSVGRLLQRPRIVELGPDSSVQPALAAVLRRGFRSAVLAPVLAGHAVVAFLITSVAGRDTLGLAELEVLSTVCEALGPTVRNEALSVESVRNAAVLHSSQAVFRAISQSLDMDQTFKEIAVNAARSIGGSGCLLLERSQETSNLVTVAASEPAGEGFVGLTVRFDGGAEDPLSRRRAIVVDDVIAGSRANEDARQFLDLRSALLVPVCIQGSAIGALVLYAVGRRQRYTERDMLQAEEVAEQAAIAIYNARLYLDLERSRESVQSLVHRISEIRQHERQRFAGVVHDDIVQSVVGSLYLLESCLGRIPEGPLQRVEEAIQVLRQTVSDARSIIWELRPPVLDELGLEASLRALEHHPAELGGGPVIVADIREVSTLSCDRATAVYRIAREATLNARRHSQADTVLITLSEFGEEEERVVRLEVRDSGVGFDLSTAPGKDHFGLAVMEEQAAVTGGRLAVDTQVGQGTCVTLEVPVAK